MENQKSIVTKGKQSDCLVCQQYLLEQRDTWPSVKHCKSLKKKCTLTQVAIKDGDSSIKHSQKNQHVESLFTVRFTPKELFDIKDIETQQPL